MSIRDLLETFEVMEPAHSNRVGAPTRETLETVRTSAYEAGYASGWEDARLADGEAHTRVQAEFERNVEALSFTYHEAVDRVRGELKTFIDALLSEFLPQILPDALREHLRAELLSAAEEGLDLPVEIVVSPDSADLVSELANGSFTVGIELIEDASLAEHQVFVRIAESEKEINLAPLISELKFQLGAMSELNNEVKAHG